MDGFGPDAGTPETLHQRSRYTEEHGFGKAELDNSDQNKKEINRQRRQHHRQTDLDARREDGNEEVQPEKQRVGRLEMCQLQCQTESAKREDQRDINLCPDWHGRKLT